jgi:hypothetical protein
MFVERTRTVAASADAGIVGSQVRIEIQIVTRHCRGVDLVSYDARTSALRQASCRILGHSLIADRSDWPTLDLKTHASHVN